VISHVPTRLRGHIKKLKRLWLLLEGAWYFINSLLPPDLHLLYVET
jgi:hypothetical protein